MPCFARRSCPFSFHPSPSQFKSFRVIEKCMVRAMQLFISARRGWLAIHGALVLTLAGCAEPVAPPPATTASATAPSNELASDSLAPSAAGSATDSTVPPGTEPAPSRSADLPSLVSVGEADAEAVCRQIEAAVRARIITDFDSHFDWDALLDRIAQGVEFPEVEKATFRSDYVHSRRYCSDILASVGPDGSFRLVRVHQKDGATRGLFRLLGNRGVVNYHDLVLERRPSGSVRVVDVYVFASGELLSETLRSAYVIDNSKAHRSVPANWLGSEGMYRRALRS